MISNNPHSCIVSSVIIIGPARKFNDPVNEWSKEIAVEIIIFALKNSSNPLQPHAGINGGLGQLCHGAVCIPIKLHKNQIPELQKAVTVATNCTVRIIASVFRALVNMDLRAGTTGTGIAHCPEIICLTQANNATLGQIFYLFPEFIGLIIFPENRNPELFRVKTQLLG